MEKERVEILTNLPGEIFLKLHRKISRHALVLLNQQYLIYLDRNNLKKCTGYYARVHGIPCAHVICKYIEIKDPSKLAILRSSGIWITSTKTKAPMQMFLEICLPFESWNRRLARGHTRNVQSVIRRGSRSLSVIVAVKNAVTATDLVTTGVDVRLVLCLS